MEGEGEERGEAGREGRWAGEEVEKGRKQGRQERRERDIDNLELSRSDQTPCSWSLSVGLVALGKSVN